MSVGQQPEENRKQEIDVRKSWYKIVSWLPIQPSFLGWKKVQMNILQKS